MSLNHDRLDRGRWLAARRFVLERDGWRCRNCGRAGRFEVDHVVPLDAGGDPYSPANLQALCRKCHHEKTGRELRKGKPRPEWAALVAELR